MLGERESRADLELLHQHFERPLPSQAVGLPQTAIVGDELLAEATRNAEPRQRRFRILVDPIDERGIEEEADTDPLDRDVRLRARIARERPLVEAG